MSGLGTYTTTVEWGGGGAYLDLGEVFDTYRVTTTASRCRPPTSSDDDRRRPVPRAGQNTITVEVATTLLNRLRAGDVAYATRRARPTG